MGANLSWFASTLLRCFFPVSLMLHFVCCSLLTVIFWEYSTSLGEQKLPLNKVHFWLTALLVLMSCSGSPESQCLQWGEILSPVAQNCCFKMLQCSTGSWTCKFLGIKHQLKLSVVIPVFKSGCAGVHHIWKNLWIVAVKGQEDCITHCKRNWGEVSGWKMLIVE